MTEDNPFAAPRMNAVDTRAHGYGGIGRWTFLAAFAVVNVAGRYALRMIELDSKAESMTREGIIFVSLILLAVPRMINMGGRSWWALGMLVPVLNLLLLLRCIAAPEGYAKHKTLDPPGKVLLLSVVATIVLFVLISFSRG